MEVAQPRCRVIFRLFSSGSFPRLLNASCPLPDLHFRSSLGTLTNPLGGMNLHGILVDPLMTPVVSPRSDDPQYLPRSAENAAWSMHYETRGTLNGCTSWPPRARFCPKCSLLVVLFTFADMGACCYRHP
ncbi:hypothetical protein RSAG8_00902, partial [Rhizoctonia solani AG-8 WAC10335]